MVGDAAGILRASFCYQNLPIAYMCDACVQLLLNVDVWDTNGLLCLLQDT